MTPTLWGEPERYGRDYWQRIPNVYYSGDSAHVDEDGYFWFAGRADEIIKIAAHRLGTIEVESAFLQASGRRRMRRRRPPRRDARRGDRRVRAAQARPRRVGRAAAGTARDRPPRARCRSRSSATLNFVTHAAEDAQRQNHAPRAEGGDPRPRSGRHHDDRGRRLGRRGQIGVGSVETEHY